MLLSGTNSTAFGGPGYSFTVINVSGATSTEALGINNRGDVVVGFTNGTGTHRFLYEASAFTAIDVPGATGGTQAYGINDSDGTGTHGSSILQVRSPRSTLRSTLVPKPAGSNASGQIVGFLLADGFLNTAGTLTPIGAPVHFLPIPSGSTIVARLQGLPRINPGVTASSIQPECSLRSCPCPNSIIAAWPYVRPAAIPAQSHRRRR
jgi:hypothetical protein